MEAALGFVLAVVLVLYLAVGMACLIAFAAVQWAESEVLPAWGDTWRLLVGWPVVVWRLWRGAGSW